MALSFRTPGPTGGRRSTVTAAKHIVMKGLVPESLPMESLFDVVHWSIPADDCVQRFAGNFKQPGWNRTRVGGIVFHHYKGI